MNAMRPLALSRRTSTAAALLILAIVLGLVVIYILAVTPVSDWHAPHAGPRNDHRVALAAVIDSLPYRRAAPVLKVEAVSPEPGDTGTFHSVDELRLSVGNSAPLILRYQHDGVPIPIPGPQYPVGDKNVLLLGWSSYGGGTETIHALLLHVEKDRVTLQRELKLTTTRASSALLIRRAGSDSILLGVPEPNGSPRNEDEWSLVLGPGKVEHLDLLQVRKFLSVVEERRNTDALYSPPFQSAPYPQRVAWILVSTDGFALTRSR